MSKLNLTLGADPELVVLDLATKLPIPAWEVTTGTKFGKKEVINADVNVHADGAALEFNINPVPPDAFPKAIRAAVHDIDRWLTIKGAILKKQLYTENKADYEGYSKEVFEHPLVLMSGCDPDFCAYDDDLKLARKVPPYPKEGLRFFGGHIHVGHNIQHVPVWALVRLVDAFVYWPVALYDTNVRKKVFGQAGCYRVKPYGFEYRTPSNFWLRSSTITDVMAHNIWGLFEKLSSGHIDRMHALFSDIDWKEVQDKIDNSEAGSNARVDWWKKIGHRINSDFVGGTELYWKI